MTDAILWFEIPATDLARAVTFYEQVLQTKLQDVSRYTGSPYALFNTQGDGVGGAIGVGPNYTPATTGVTIYLHVQEDLEQTLARVEAAGGQVITPKSPLPQGYFAIIRDTEGNRIGLRSR